jgi:hypothetical protein
MVIVVDEAAVSVVIATQVTPSSERWAVKVLPFRVIFTQ